MKIVATVDGSWNDLFNGDTQFTLSDEHAASSHGIPVAVRERDNQALGSAEVGTLLVSADHGRGEGLIFLRQMAAAGYKIVVEEYGSRREVKA